MEEALPIKEKKEWLLKVIFSVILYTIAFTLIFRYTGITMSDYSVHMRQSEQLYRGNFINYIQSNPYFMWHFLVRVFYKIFAMPMEYATAVFSALVHVAVYLVAAEIMKKHEIDKSEVISFFLMFAGPLYAPWYNQNYYLGQYSPNIWHNPTSLMVKPFAACCFFMILGFLTDIGNGKKIKRSRWAVLSILIFLSVVAKPSFVQGMIPGLGVYLIYICVKNRFQRIKEYICLCLTFVPGVLLVLYQMSTFWGAGGTRGAIKIGWLKVISYRSPDVWISLLLSFGFPLLYIVLNRKRTLARTDVQLSICYFVMAWLEYAVLYETVATYSGNFGWAQVLATFILWTVIIICFFQDIQHFRMDDKLLTIKNTVLMVVLSIHLLCGCWYVYTLIIGPAWL